MTTGTEQKMTTETRSEPVAVCAVFGAPADNGRREARVALGLWCELRNAARAAIRAADKPNMPDAPYPPAERAGRLAAARISVESVARDLRRMARGGALGTEGEEVCRHLCVLAWVSAAGNVMDETGPLSDASMAEYQRGLNWARDC